MFKKLFDRLNLSRLAYRARRRLEALERAGAPGKAATFRDLVARADELAALPDEPALLAQCALVASLLDGVRPIERLLLAEGLAYSVRCQRLKVVTLSLAADRTESLLKALRSAGIV